MGRDAPPENEIVRFRSLPSVAFPATAVSSIRANHAARGALSDQTLQMCVTFMGLTGPTAVLPDQYTRLLADRSRQGDPALHEFLDLFHHRLLSLFFRSWEKYNVTFCYEQARVCSGPGEDRFTNCLFSLIGLGTDQQRERLNLPDQSLLFYLGHLSDGARSTTGLEDVLSGYFEFPVTVEQFQGRWLYLNPEDTSRLPSTTDPQGQYSVLGRDFVLGQRVWNVQSKFRLKLGSIDYRQFLRLLPNGEDAQMLDELTRLYVGLESDFDVRLVLQAEEVPELRLHSDPRHAPRLGWNTWTFTEPIETDAENAFFTLDSTL